MDVRDNTVVTEAQLAALKFAKMGSISGHVHGTTIRSLQRRGLLNGLAITEAGLAIVERNRLSRKRR